MPPSSREKESVYGNVIEYIQDRLYLACYTAPPTSNTPFPPPPIPNPYYGPPEPGRNGTPSNKRTRRSTDLNITPGQRPVYFSIDDHLLYNAFFHDFGPLHIGHLYRFAVTLHDILGEKANEGRSVVFWSKPDAKSRSNAAALLACYMVLIQSWPPHLALAPISQCEPPLMPFRDAGYSQADYSLQVQDVVYGVWKAKEKGILNIKEFCLEEYEKYERVDMGDFNWVTPNFLAFASPQHKPANPAREPPIPTTLAGVQHHPTLSQPFKNVLHHFSTRDVGLVVRLNEDLYPAAYFTALGITHLDMYFDDGTCPPLSLVRRFVNLAHCAITVHGKNIAVHCKAGLGRTGCLIGAYLVYRYGFTANEVIAYMRFMRPGMVVGPQQHWLHLNQGEFRQWWYEDMCTPVVKAAGGIPSTPSKSKTGRLIPTDTPPSQGRRVLGEVDNNEAGATAALPAPTPGQPRKTSKKFGMTSATSTGNSAAAARVPSTASVYEDTDDQNVDPAAPTGIYEKKARKVHTTRSASAKKYDVFTSAGSGTDDGMSEEEYLLRQTMTATATRRRRTSSSRSPRGKTGVATRGESVGVPGSGKRSVSYTMTTTTTTVSATATAGGTTPPGMPKMLTEKSGSGAGGLAGVKVRVSPRRREGREEGGSTGGVRKVSGRLAAAHK